MRPSIHPDCSTLPKISVLLICLLLRLSSPGESVAREPADRVTRQVEPAQGQVFDLAVGNVTIDTNTVIPGLQTENTLEGVYFIYGESYFSPIPVIAHFQISDSTGTPLFIWDASAVIPDGTPQIHYEGRYQYPLPEGTRLPLDIYTLKVTVEPDPAQVDLFPNGVIPPETDLTNNTNQSVGTQILQLSGKVVFGDITTELTSLQFFDIPNMQISGTVAWTTDIPVTLTGIGVSRDETTLDLAVTAGSASFVTPTTPYQPEGSLWKFNYTEGVLDSAGAYAVIAAVLPEGMGYRGAKESKNTFAGTPFPLGRLKLTQTLLFALNPLPLDLPLYWSDERLAYHVYAEKQEFDPAVGFKQINPKPVYRFEPHFAANFGEGIRPSNCGYLQGTLQFNGEVFVKPDGVEATVASATVAYKTSYPYQAEVALQNGTWDYRSGKMQTGLSSAVAAKITQVVNASGCAAKAVPIAAEFNSTAVFSEDSAFAVDSTVAAPIEPDFNTYNFEPVSRAVWYQPGIMLPLGSMKSGTDVAEYLQAMRERENPLLHSYGSPAFRDGTGVFAGLNLMPEEMQAKPFKVRVDVSEQDFTATEWTKLYVRPGGFSGVVDAQSAGQNLELYSDPECDDKGYSIKIASFGQAYLDNDSRGLSSTTDGRIDLPWPSAIQLPFEEMVLNGCGNFSEGKVPAAAKSIVKTLAYWQADLRILTFAFPLRPGATADNHRTLWISSKNHIERLDHEPTMQTNIRPCGTIRDSKIESPVLSRYDGYATTIQKIYLSAWDQSTSPNGFYNLIGDLVVSFFNPPKVHLLVRGPVGEMVGGNPWFDLPDPDPDRDGFPSTIAITSTQINDKFSEYVNKEPIALQARFANLIDLKYKVEYNKAKKEFASTEPLAHDLIVLDIKSAVEYLNASRTEISFGVDVGALPELNLSSAASEFAAPIRNSFLGPVRDQLEDASRKLTGDLTTVVRPVMKAAVQPFVQEWVNQLTGHLQTLEPAQYAVYITGAEFQSRLDSLFVNVNLSTRLRTPDTMPVVQTIQDVLQKLRSVSDVLHYNPSDLTAQLGPLVQSLLEVTLNLLGSSTGYDLNRVLQPIQQTVNDINRYLDTEVLPALASAETAFNNPILYLDQYFKPAEIAALEVQIKTALRANLQTLATTSPSQAAYITADRVTDSILTEVFNSSMFRQLNAAVTTKLYPVQEALTDQAQLILDGINDAVSDFIKTNVGDVIDGVAADIKGVAGFKGASMKGYAVVNGNVMEKLHIDAEFSMSVPDEFKFAAYLDMTRYQSKNDGKTCTDTLDGKEYLDCRIGAKGIKVTFPAASLEADIGLKFMLSGGALVNVGGDIVTRGYLGFESFQILDPSFGVSVGKVENYFWATAGVKFDSYLLKGGIFLGTSCDLEPLKKIDPEVASLLTVTEMRGIYLGVGGSFPILNFGCLLRVGVSAHIAFWYFADGPTFGGKMVAGAYGEAACVVSIKGQLSLIAGKDPGGIFFKGQAWAGGGIGFCDPEDWNSPDDVLDDSWCASCVAVFDLIYKNDDWDADYDVDCSL